jgi:predicted lactoylglutathione lyase
MADQPSRKIFVNLAVRDLKKSMQFFSTLGFEFNPKFTDDNAASMIVSNEAFVMLLTEPFFKTSPAATSATRCVTRRDSSRSPAAAGKRWTSW